MQVVSNLREQFPHLKLVIVGDAKTPTEQAYKATLLKTVRSLGLENTVIFTGWQKDPAAYYAMFDLYLLTSMPFEGVPGSVIEAVVAGLPVVGFDCYGLREIPGISARLAATGDLGQLTAVLQAAVAQLSQARQVRRTHTAHLSLMQARFSMSRMVDQTFELYQPLLEHNAGLDQERARSFYPRS